MPPDISPPPEKPKNETHVFGKYIFNKYSAILIAKNPHTSTYIIPLPRPTKNSYPPVAIVIIASSIIGTIGARFSASTMLSPAANAPDGIHAIHVAPKIIRPRPDKNTRFNRFILSIYYIIRCIFCQADGQGARAAPKSRRPVQTALGKRLPTSVPRAPSRWSARGAAPRPAPS